MVPMPETIQAWMAAEADEQKRVADRLTEARSRYDAERAQEEDEAFAFAARQARSLPPLSEEQAARIAALTDADAPAGVEIRAACNRLADFLIAKNRKYGNSALDPQRYVLRADVSVEDIIASRMDEKINRIVNQQEDDEEDALKDLVGYWILREVVRARAS